MFNNNTDNKPKIIIANWKMNPDSFGETDNLIKIIKKGIKKSDNLKVIICPPAVYLSKIKANSGFDLGIQNIFWEDRGAFTGEISAIIAKNLKIKYTIIGHSERRKYLNETDEMVNLKMQSALKNKLSPILCIGETLEEKKKDVTSGVITNQLKKAFKGISNIKYSISNICIAYEPVWAIGTSKTPSIDEIMSVNLLIKKTISNLYDRETAEKISILYGGSVDSKNAFDFVDKTGMDGLLIGGASLNGSEFARIVNLFE
ncbi:MAG: triose-phosphate isomerase [Candidatus Pacebacteria bacterium]|nr:triose-phosphate isomerase [Candidatus Paceibacterota bacterium]